MRFSFQAMVARGDLGAELPIEEVPLLQVAFIVSDRSEKPKITLLIYCHFPVANGNAMGINLSCFYILLRFLFLY